MTEPPIPPETTPEDEILEVVNEQGEVVGLVPRSAIHGDPSLMHRVVHVLVFNKKGEILLQKRSMSKDVAPGRWDTSVGGHVGPAEGLLDAAMREMLEELGIEAAPRPLYSYVHSNTYETELVHTFRADHEGGFSHNAHEIDEVRFWPLEEIKKHMGRQVFSDNFEHEINLYMGMFPA